MDWAAEGLLDGLEGETAEGRRALLDALHADGVPLEELRAAVAEDRLVLVPIERALLSPARYTLAEVAERSGLDLELVAAGMRTMGIHVPEDAEARAFGDEDVAWAERSRRYLEAGVPLDQGRAATHVMSSAMARTADAVRRLFAEAYLRPGDTEKELAERFASMAEALTPLLAADLEYLLRHHLRDFARHDALGMSERVSGRLPDAAEVGVAFADIVGFTRLGQDLPESELSEIAERLESLASEHVKRPARVVKTIGDAVMVVSPELPPLLDAMLDLVEAAGATENFPPVRAGVDYGRAVGRLGDWFGPTVNLASRLTTRARAESVLTTNHVRDALGDAAERYRFSEAGLKRLKNIEEPVPTLRVRRASADPD